MDISTGSASVVVDLFEYCINSILFQRGLYPREEFTVTQKYGLSLIVTRNGELRAYIEQIIDQIRVWLRENKLNKVVLVIKSKDTGETIERWQFDIEAANTEDKSSDDMEIVEGSVNLTEETKSQIRGIMRQISASVTFLPELDHEDCSFTILVHTEEDVQVPEEWGDSDPSLIKGGGAHMKLKPISTNFHKVTPIVAYRPTTHDDM